MNKLNLKTLYRDATRALPRDADLRVSTDELLALANGESLGARQEAVVTGLAASSEQAIAARVAMATSDWSQALADDLSVLRRPSLGERLAEWFKVATLPPVFAACAISLLAVAAWGISEPALAPHMVPMPQLATDAVVFGGDFDDSVAHNDDSDELFGGGFDS